MVVALHELICNEVPVSLMNAIARFTCQDKDVETFLKDKAFEFERRDKSRTYLILDDESGILLEYFTISLAALSFGDGVSKNTVKRIDGFSKDVRAVGIILIGQFGKDCVLAKHVRGVELLDICMRTIKRVKNIIGGRFVMLECLDVKSVVSFYETNGFKLLQVDDRDKYLQMIRRL